MGSSEYTVDGSGVGLPPADNGQLESSELEGGDRSGGLRDVQVSVKPREGSAQLPHSIWLPKPSSQDQSERQVGERGQLGEQSQAV